MALSQMFALASAHTSSAVAPVAALLLSIELEKQTLTTALDKQLSEQCKAIREDFQKGARQKALLAIQSYLDRFDTDLHVASKIVRAMFWYTAGVLQWKIPPSTPTRKRLSRKGAETRSFTRHTGPLCTDSIRRR